MNTKKQEPLKLESMAPLDDGGRKYNTIYIIAVVMGIIIGICMHNGIESILVANCLTILIAFMIKDSILDIKWKRLRKQKFLLENRVSYDVLIHHLIGQLLPLGFQVEKGGEGNPVLTRKKMIYDVEYDEGDTFTIYWRKSITNAFFDFRTPIYHYRVTVADMGIIGYTVQQVCCGNTDVNVQQKNSAINTGQRNGNDINQDLYKLQPLLDIFSKKWYIAIGIILFLLIILGGLFWLGSSSDDKAADGRGDGKAVVETAPAEESYDKGEYAVDDIDENVSYGLNEAVEFEVEGGGKISIIFTEYGKKDDTTYISYVIQNIGEAPVTVGESMFSVYANDYAADLDYGEKTVYSETVSAGRKVSGRLYPRVTLAQVRKLEVECGDTVFLLRDTSAADAMLGTYYRQYEDDGDIITDEVRLFRDEYDNALTISAVHHIDYENGYVGDYDVDFYSTIFQLYDDRIEFTGFLYPVGGLIVYYSKNPMLEGISITQVDTVSTDDVFTGSYEWTDNIQTIYESAKSAGTAEETKIVENTMQEKESILLNDLCISTVSASSELAGGNNIYKAEALFDGNRDTCWAEGVDGTGEGEYVEVRFTNPLYLTEIGFLNGYMKNEDVFKANGKIRKIEIGFSDGSSCEVDLEKGEYQNIKELLYSDMVSFENPVWTDYLRITILEAESGAKYDDTCLTEIAIWGYQDNETEMSHGTELTVIGKGGLEFYVDSSILGTYSCYMGEDFGAEIALTYDEKIRQLNISGNCWAGMNIGMIEDEMVSEFVAEEKALMCSDEYGNQLYIYPLDTGEIYIKQNGDFGGIGTTFEGTYEK